MSKNKIELTPEINVDEILQKVKENHSSEEISTIDGVKIDFPENWVHLRKSNTEPIIRIYTEAKSQQEADELAEKMIKEIKEIAFLRSVIDCRIRRDGSILMLPSFMRP
jgi:phosphomannomutase